VENLLDCLRESVSNRANVASVLFRAPSPEVAKAFQGALFAERLGASTRSPADPLVVRAVFESRHVVALARIAETWGLALEQARQRGEDHQLEPPLRHGGAVPRGNQDGA
jgi:hypothetical protein